ncbi:putative caspase-16 isoform 3-T4 [Callospermophilus lateralis]|uniref:putative caspase-16 isoform X3 n=1 Tax=Callospermophilus lateralis TaxID=76772 RepID=UPI00403881A1
MGCPLLPLLPWTVCSGPWALKTVRRGRPLFSCPGARSLPHWPEGALWPLSSLVPAATADRGNRDAGVGPVALPWYWRCLRTPPAIPTQADVLQIHTDAQGCVAYRDEKGSDLVQTLVEVLRANPTGDLLELLTEVNRLVCELDVLGPDCNELRKACLEIRSSLRRRLCLQA